MNKKVLIIIAAVFVILASVGIILFAVMSGNGGDNSSSDSSLPVSDASANTPPEDDKTNSVKLYDVARVDITVRGDVNDFYYIPCTVNVYYDGDSDTPDVTDKRSKIKIRGNSTSSGDKKPYNIKFSEKTDLFGFGPNTRWSLLANLYDKTLIRNQTVYDFAERIGLKCTPSHRVADIYLNGKLLGSYLIVDSIDAAEDRIDIDNEGNEFCIEYVIPTRNDEGKYYTESPIYGYRFAVHEPEEPTRDQKNWLKNYLKEAESALYSCNYKNVSKYFDIESMVDFYIVNELFKNVDIAIGSTYFYIKDDKIYGGPVWDFDLSAGNCSYDYFNYYEYNNINGEGNGSGNNWEGIYCDKLWFDTLMDYPEFVNAVKQRYAELSGVIENLYKDNELGKNYIDTVTEHYGESFARNYKEGGWRLHRPYCDYERQNPSPTYKANVEYYRDWLKKRHNWLTDYFNSL